MMNKTLKMGFLASAALAAFVSVSSFAEEAKTETTPAPVAASEKAATKDTRVASNKMKMKEAKEACLKDNPALKGADLRKCIKEKRAQ